MTKVLAHRGASSICPDNTMLAFEKAYALGADGVELDVYTLFDETVVVSHDAFVYRGEERIPIFCFDGKSIRQEYALSEFEQFKRERFPYFREALEFLKDKNMYLNVEIKPDSGYCHVDTVGCVMRLMQQFHMQDQSIVSSFDHRFLRAVRERFPGFQTGVLYSNAFIPDMAAYCRQFGFDALHPLHTLVSQEYIDHAHKNGLLVNPWTVNDRPRMEELRDWGVDSLISNDAQLSHQVCHA